MDELVLTESPERAIPSQRDLYEFERIYNYTIDSFSSQDKVILDYGCGSGYGTSLLAKKFGKVTGVDVSPEAIAFCNQNYSRPNLNFFVLDPTTQPFADHSFDHIFSFQVFEHVPLHLTGKYIENIWNMLAPGGTAVVTTPNAFNYVGLHSGNPFHIKEYTLSELDSAFGNILHKDNYKIFAVHDVPSTAMQLRVNKFMKGAFPTRTLGAKLLSRLLNFPSLILKMMEIYLKMFQNHKGILATSGCEGVFGSYYVEIRKPSPL